MKKLFTVLLFITLQVVSSYGQDCFECPIPSFVSFTDIGDNNFEYRISATSTLCSNTLEVLATTIYCDGTVVQNVESISTVSPGPPFSVFVTGVLSLDNNGQPIDRVIFEYFSVCESTEGCNQFCPTSSVNEITSEVGECSSDCDPPFAKLVCVDGNICLFVNLVLIDDNPDYELNGGQPSCFPANWAEPGDIRSYDIVCTANPAQNWLTNLPVPLCASGCADPLPELICVDGEICLFVRDVPIADNPDYFLNGGQPSCIPGNWAETGDLLPYDIVCAADPSQNWLVDLPAPECELACGPVPNVSLFCQAGQSFCIAVNGTPIDQQSDYKGRIIDIPSSSGCVNIGVAIPPVGSIVQVEIFERVGCSWIIPVEVPNCSEEAPVRSEEERLIGTSDFSIYPNPAMDHVSIDLSEYEGETGDINIYNNLGQVIISKQIEEISTTPVYIPLADKSFGIHLVSVKIGNKKVISKKLMINIE